MLAPPSRTQRRRRHLRLPVRVGPEGGVRRAPAVVRSGRRQRERAASSLSPATTCRRRRRRCRCRCRRRGWREAAFCKHQSTEGVKNAREFSASIGSFFSWLLSTFIRSHLLGDCSIYSSKLCGLNAVYVCAFLSIHVKNSAPDQSMCFHHAAHRDVIRRISKNGPCFLRHGLHSRHKYKQQSHLSADEEVWCPCQVSVCA